MEIREQTIEDLPVIDAIRRVMTPWNTASLATQRVWFEGEPPEARPLRLLAMVDERAVGYGICSFDLYTSGPSTGHLDVKVLPEARRRGIGTALYEMLEKHLTAGGAQRIQAFTLDEPGAAAFADRYGYVRGATEIVVVIDPRKLPAEPPRAAGATIVSAREAGPEVFHRVSDVAARDEPGDTPFAGMPYQDFLTFYWPSIDQDVSLVALVDGEPAAATALSVNQETLRAMSAGTDTLREFRGRGLAKSLKWASLRACVERGITAAYTMNDEVNAPMRAVNAWLGYERAGMTYSAVKNLRP